MFVSAEVIALLGVGVTLLVAFFGSFAWLHGQMDRRFDAVDKRFDAVERRFQTVDGRFDAVDRRFAEIERDLADVKRDLAGVTVSVARIEGPRPRFITAP